jgi:hypothetical protein
LASATRRLRFNLCFLHCSRIALCLIARCLIARSARCDVRSVAAVFVGSGGTEKRCPAISFCRSAARRSRIRRRRRSQRKNASAHSSSVQRRAIPDAAAHRKHRWVQRGTVSRLMVLARRSARVSGFFPSSIHRAYSLRWVKGSWSYAAFAAGFSANAAVSSGGSTTTRS